MQFSIAVLMAISLAFIISRENFVNRSKIPFDPLQLGYIRCIVSISLLILLLHSDLSSSLKLPAELSRGKTTFSYLFDNLELFDIRNPLFLMVLRWLTIISMILSAFGLGTRFIVFIAAFSYSIYYHVQITYTHLFHSGLIPLQILFLLSVLPATRAFSLDSLLCQKFTKARTDNSSPVFGYGIFMCWCVYACDYFMTGLHKFSADPFWAGPNTLKNYSITDSLTLIGFDWNLSPYLAQMGLSDYIWIILGIGGMTTEISAILILFHPIFRKFLPVFMLNLHIGIFFLHEFLFSDVIFLPLMFLNIRWLLNKLAIFRKPAPSQPYIPEIKRAYASIACSFVITTLLSGWLFNKSFFPAIDPWGMYRSSIQSSVVTYRKVFYTLENGHRVRTDLTEFINWLNNARWLDLTALPKDGYTPRAKLAFQSLAHHYNLTAPPDKKIKSFQLELWEWDYVSDRNNPEFGNISHTWDFPVS